MSITAIVDGVTVIGTPEEINRMIELRGKQHTNWDVAVRDMLSNVPKENCPPLNSVITAINYPGNNGQERVNLQTT